jgi:hypothetical protein
MKEVLVIHEKDSEDCEQIIIGVADSGESAEKMIREYYGDYKLLKHHSIHEASVEYLKWLEVKNHLNEPHIVRVHLKWFTVNEA